MQYIFKFFLVSLLLCVKANTIAQLLHDPHSSHYTSTPVDSLDRLDLKTTELKVQTDVGELDFQVHFKIENIAYVKKVFGILNNDIPNIVKYFNYAPKDRIHIVIRNTRTLANGSAQVFPYSVINLFTFPPTGNKYLVHRGDWIRTLLVHEMVHIIHMDMTSGFLKGVETLFGNVGKLGGVVPRWFSEGLATWGESRFTFSGRGYSSRLFFDLESNLLNNESCKSIDCLDNPGIYPLQSNAYWMGAAFLIWLEAQKRNSLSCIVKENSSQFPFFLNSAFKKCTGKTADENFKDYLIFVRDDIKKTKPINSKHLFAKKLPIKGLNINYQAGISVFEGKVLYVSDDRGRSFLNTYSIKKDKHKSLRLDENIYALLSEKDGVYFSTTKYRPGQTYRNLRFFNGEKIIKEDLKDNFDYYFLYRGTSYYFKYLNERWGFYKKGRDEPLIKFRKLEDIQRPYLFGDKIIFKSTLLSGISRHAIKEIDLTNKRVRIVRSFKNYFSIIGKCSDSLVLNVEGQRFRYYKGKTYRLNNAGKRLVIVEGNDKANVWFFSDQRNRAYVSESSCDDVFKSFGSDDLILDSSKQISQSFDRDINYKKYFDISHYKPTYWLLSVNAGDTTTGYTGTTSLSDPLNINTFNINATWYTSINQLGGGIDYSRDWTYFQTSVGYSKFYRSRGIDERNDAFENMYASISKPMIYGGWTFTNGAGVSKSNVSDFISSRTTESTYVFSNTTYTPYLIDSFFNVFNFNTRLFRNETSGFQEFYGGEGKVFMKFRPGFYWDIDLEASHGRMAKSGFRSGVLYAGGLNDAFTSNYHWLYALDRNDALGNSISTMRGTVDWVAANVFKGWGLTPLYLRRLHLFAGMEYFKADRIFVGQQLLFNKDLNASFAGIGFESTLFYLAPANIDLVLSQLNNKYGEDDNRFLLVIRGDFYP